MHNQNNTQTKKFPKQPFRSAVAIFFPLQFEFSKVFDKRREKKCLEEKKKIQRKKWQHIAVQKCTQIPKSTGY